MDLTSTLFRALQRVTKLEDEALTELDVTNRQVVLLRFFAEHDGASQTRAVADTDMDRSTLADITKRLVDKGLLTRKRTRHDARMYAVGITARGASTLAEAERILARVQMEAFPTTVRHDLPKMLERIAPVEVREAAE